MDWFSASMRNTSATLASTSSRVRIRNRPLLVVDPLDEQLQELQRDLRVAHHEHLEVLAVELQRLHVVQRDGRGGARRLFQDGHLAEDLPGVEDVDVLFQVPDDAHDLHPSGLDEVEGVPRLVLAEDDVALAEGDLEKRLNMERSGPAGLTPSLPPGPAALSSPCGQPGRLPFPC